MSTPGSISGTLGVFFIGTVIGSMLATACLQPSLRALRQLCYSLFGITIMQGYIYFSRNFDDRVWFQVAVAALCVLDALHLAFTVDIGYRYLITDLCNPALMGSSFWSLRVRKSQKLHRGPYHTKPPVLLLRDSYKGGFTILCLTKTNLSSIVYIWKEYGNVLFFFVIFDRRITDISQVLSNVTGSKRRVSLTTITFGVAALCIAAGFVVIVTLAIEPNLNPKSRMWFGWLELLSSAILDCAITIAMIVLLGQGLQLSRRMKSLTTTLIHYTIATGLITSIACILYLVLYEAITTSPAYSAMEASNSSLYANAILTMLNAREHLRGQPSGGADTLDVSRAIRFDPGLAGDVMKASDPTQVRLSSLVARPE
ncbi:hypothetical protein JAAARDRAFT_191413 [Jaapia argillacea MUCL 33604]|uniref:DUF6534 domain-containing protein n=1 Tax=Jaapia argillacea MUCL 33604 TaxID=933084 RepID=A0A067PZ67_9AGAM|nr:hypothetical protein JAAARDRAFT_191413 [Jaapia argillacea MUCL 33604]